MRFIMAARLLTPEMTQTVRERVREYGELAIAADAVGLSLTQLRGVIANDEDLRLEIADAMEEHSALLYTEALRRATQGRSDVLMSKLLDARHKAFDKDAAKELAKQRNRPAALVLRTFEESPDGTVRESAEPTPAPPAEPLRIGWRAI